MARSSCGAKAPLPPRARPKSQLQFVPRDTEKLEFLDWVDFGGVAISVETIICVAMETIVCGIMILYESS